MRETWKQHFATGITCAIIGWCLGYPYHPEKHVAEPIAMMAGVDEHEHDHAFDGDPHSDPRWHHFRREEAKTKPDHCEWKDCPHSADELHHGIAAKWCVMADHPELVYTRGKGQWFLWLCRTHHAMAHDVCDGCGGSWSKFNPDSQADAKAGQWNSRGKSAWPFKTDAEAIHWIKGRCDE